MKSIGLMIVAVIFISNCCTGQSMNKGNTDEKSNTPKTNIKVNKEFDKDGNLIRYDSTYSYFYSNTENNPLLSDSIFNTFKDHFNQNYFYSKDPYFENFFFKDSLLMQDFYKKDFFINRFKNNSEALDSLFYKMDQLKNDYFDRQFNEFNKDKSKN
jgi:hypothetical protein